MRARFSELEKRVTGEGKGGWDELSKAEPESEGLKLISWLLGGWMDGQTRWTDGDRDTEIEVLCVLLYFLTLSAKKVSKQQYPSSSEHTQHLYLGF